MVYLQPYISSPPLPPQPFCHHVHAHQSDHHDAWETSLFLNLVLASEIVHPEIEQEYLNHKCSKHAHPPSPKCQKQANLLVPLPAAGHPPPPGRHPGKMLNRDYSDYTKYRQDEFLEGIWSRKRNQSSHE